MDDLSGLLAELEAPPDTVWLRVTANALDPSAPHENLAHLVPDPGDFADLPVDPGEMFADDLDEDDPDADADVVYMDDLGGSTVNPEDVGVDPELTDPHVDTGGLDENPDAS